MTRLRLFAFIITALFCAILPTPAKADAPPGVVEAGKQIFKHEVLNGNDRTCSTCHVGKDGDLKPSQVQAIFDRNPNDPLFRSIDSDDGVGNSYNFLLRDATVRIPFKLPSNVTVEDPDGVNSWVNPDGTFTVVVRRSVPSVNNMALTEASGFLMWDGREAFLPHQAQSAFETHSEPGRLPLPGELDALAEYQRSLFTSNDLKHYANGNGPAPQLPLGTTAQEQLGRTFFVDHPRGLCAMCHSGPNLDEVNEFNPFEGFFGRGAHFATNFSSELAPNPDYPYFTLHYQMPDGSERVLVSQDPGTSLVDGNPCGRDPFVCIINQTGGVSVFRTTSLWGVSKTAPYMHNNALPDLEAVGRHYEQFMFITGAGSQDPRFFITTEERDAIVAFLKLL